jgi:hypothetical protein
MSAICILANSAPCSASSDQRSGGGDVTAQTGCAIQQITPDKVDRSSLALWSEKDSVAHFDQIELPAFAAVQNGCRRDQASS